MPVPKQRLSSRRGRTRAAHHALSKVATAACPNCKQPIMPHRACPACGFYRGRNINAKATSKVATSAKKPAAKKATKAEAKPAADAKQA